MIVIITTCHCEYKDQNELVTIKGALRCPVHRQFGVWKKIATCDKCGHVFSMTGRARVASCPQCDKAPVTERTIDRSFEDQDQLSLWEIALAARTIESKDTIKYEKEFRMQPIPKKVSSRYLANLSC